MRHGKRINHLGRTAAHRKAMLANMASSLIEHKRINTTVAKARELKKFVEPLITRSKVDSTHNRRIVFSYLRNKEAVSELFRDVITKVGDRPGGYTRIIKTGNRLGDNAEMCMIELVDFNDLYSNEKKSGGTKRRRRRGGGGGSSQAKPKAVAPEATEAQEDTTTSAEEVTKEAPAATAESEAKTEGVAEATPEASEENKPADEEAAESTKETEAKKEEDKPDQEKKED